MRKAEFLEKYEKFQLGSLPTEQPHPKTIGLAELVKKNLTQAVETLKEVDLDALILLKEKSSQVESLRQACQKVLKQKGRIFLCGCGATGRLSMLTEFLFREKYKTDQVVSFMAGGDVALVHSLEGFEDYPELGARHLMQMGFTERDLLISVTEGGETPFVIGATEKAVEISKHHPYFLYCNPDEVLTKTVERSRCVLENSQIQPICLYVGPMALSGSTRMQASTVLQLALGAALVETDIPVEALFQEFIEEVQGADFKNLVPFIEKERWIYSEKEYLMYMPRDFAITVFTDTTERSPTFSLPAFENNDYRGENPSLCYILIPSANKAHEAWEQLLNHQPHALDWGEIDIQTKQSYLESFDFSKNSLEKREDRVGETRQYLFEIQDKSNTLHFSLAGLEEEWAFLTNRSLLKHTLLKLLLNIHSTALMGLMGRYKSNVMTWVTPTNGKLIDRATRYILQLLYEEGICPEYLQVVDKIYELQPTIKNSECVVLKAMDQFREASAPVRSVR